ncbi:hypothetical protein ACROYT_G037721 [Oculina patagonica]
MATMKTLEKKCNINLSSMFLFLLLGQCFRAVIAERQHDVKRASISEEIGNLKSTLKVGGVAYTQVLMS